jgi:hypothetical protein
LPESSPLAPDSFRTTHAYIDREISGGGSFPLSLFYSILFQIEIIMGWKWKYIPEHVISVFSASFFSFLFFLTCRINIIQLLFGEGHALRMLSIYLLLILFISSMVNIIYHVSPKKVQDATN